MSAERAVASKFLAQNVIVRAPLENMRHYKSKNVNNFVQFFSTHACLYIVLSPTLECDFFVQPYLVVGI